LILDADFVLGLDLDRAIEARPDRQEARSLEPDLEALMAERSKARSARDFARADELRDQLRARGIEVTDETGGTSAWRRVSD
jgi:cysteinyl-tRNA synthetase